MLGTLLSSYRHLQPQHHPALRFCSVRAEVGWGRGRTPGLALSPSPGAAGPAVPARPPGSSAAHSLPEELYAPPQQSCPHSPTFWRAVEWSPDSRNVNPRTASVSEAPQYLPRTGLHTGVRSSFTPDRPRPDPHVHLQAADSSAAPPPLPQQCSSATGRRAAPCAPQGGMRTRHKRQRA